MGRPADAERSRFRFESSELGPILHYTRAPAFDTFLDEMEAIYPGALLDVSPARPDMRDRLPAEPAAAKDLHGLGHQVHLLRSNIGQDIVVVWERTDPTTAELAVLARSWKRAARLMVQLVGDDGNELAALTAGRGSRRAKQKLEYRLRHRAASD